MAPRRKIGLSELADSVLANVEQELVEKTAMSYTSNAAVNTEVAKLMVKLADEVKNSKVEITYDDLMEFRKRHNV